MTKINSLFKRTALSSAIIATLGLTACGGGGGGGSSSGGSSFSATSSGTAAKGIINGGLVTAEEINDLGEVIREVGSAITGEDGTYSLTIGANYNGGPIKLTLTSDADTQMKCDATAGCGTALDPSLDTNTNSTTDFGEWYKPGDGAITMTALIPSAENGADISASITPFTQMAAQRVIDSGNYDADAVSNANSVVTQILGVNILSTPPVDITDLPEGADAQEIAYAALAASAASLSDTNLDGVLDMQTGIDALASALSSGGITADDEGNDETVSLKDIIDGASSALSEAGVVDTSLIVSNLQEAVNNVDESGNINPDPIPTATLSRVEKAKALVEDFRTYAIELDSAVFSNTEFAAEFNDEISIASDVVEQISGEDNPVAAIASASEIVLNATEVFDFESTKGNDSYSYSAEQTIDFSVNPSFGFTSGTVSIDASGTGSYSQVGPCNTEEGVPADTTYSCSSSSDENYDGIITFTNAVYGSQELNMTFDTPDSIYEEFWSDAGDEYSSDYTYTETESRDETLKVSGDVESENGVILAIAEDTLLEVESSQIYSDTTAPEGYSYFDRRLEIANLDLDVTMTIPTGPDSNVEVAGQLEANVFSVLDEEFEYVDESGLETESEYEGVFVSSLAFNGDITANSETTAFTITAAMPNAKDILDSIEAREDSSTYAFNFGIGFSVDLNELQDVSVTFTTSGNLEESIMASLALEAEDRNITIQGSYPEGESDITVTNLDGVELVITPPASPSEPGVIGEVTINGNTVATIESLEDGLIKTNYEDGTFDIF